jgi:hypothetical protein
MFKLKTGNAEHYTIEGETLLAVPFDIVNLEGTVVHSTRQSFPLTASVAEIRAVLEQFLAVYTDDHLRHESVKEHQAALDASAEAAQEISQITL